MISKHIKEKVKEFFEFSLVGVTSSAMMLFGTVIMTEVFGIGYKTSYAAGLALSYAYQFFLNMKITFTCMDRPMLRIERFATVSIFILLLNWALVVFCVEILGWTYWICIIVILAVLGTLNFELEEVWVFRKIPKSKHHRIEHHLMAKVRERHLMNRHTKGSKESEGQVKDRMLRGKMRNGPVKTTSAMHQGTR